MQFYSHTNQNKNIHLPNRPFNNFRASKSVYWRFSTTLSAVSASHYKALKSLSAYRNASTKDWNQCPLKNQLYKTALQWILIKGQCPFFVCSSVFHCQTIFRQKVPRPSVLLRDLAPSEMFQTTRTKASCRAVCLLRIIRKKLSKVEVLKDDREAGTKQVSMINKAATEFRLGAYMDKSGKSPNHVLQWIDAWFSKQLSL